MEEEHHAREDETEKAKERTQPEPESIMEENSGVGKQLAAEKKSPVKKKTKKRFAAGRGKDTLFRVSSRNQIELLAIADNKANIIVGINVILLSLIMAFVGSGLTVEGLHLTKLEVYLPFGILLLTCLVSAIFAILSAKPRIITAKKQKDISILFFQNYYRMTLPVYLEALKKVLNSKEEVYDHLIIDMYYNGIILRRKYWMLSISYTIFMIGIVLSVVAFLITSMV